MSTFSLVELSRPGREGQEQATWSG
jgi:hypothetical protein